MTEKNSTGNLNGKQELLGDNVVVLQSDIAEAMSEDELFRLKVINKALNRENKQLKEQVKTMGEKEKTNAKSR